MHLETDGKYYNTDVADTEQILGNGESVCDERVLFDNTLQKLSKRTILEKCPDISTSTVELTLASMLKEKLKSANVNIRSLRATLLIDLALTGNVKVLEVLGLSLDGCKPT